MIYFQINKARKGINAQRLKLKEKKLAPKKKILNIFIQLLTNVQKPYQSSI